LYGIRIIVAVSIALIAFIGLVDLLVLSKKSKQARQAKAFATGLGLGMIIFQTVCVTM
jgi:hypothetical protein